MTSAAAPTRSGAAIERPPLWRVWIAASRPATLGASIAPVVAATALARASGAARVEVFVAAILGAIAIQVGTNLANDYYDWKKGADDQHRLGPPRATQRGWLSPRAVAAGAAVAFALAVLAGVQLVMIGGWPIVALGLASIAAGVGYTAGRYALAYVGLGEIFVLGFFGVAAVGATYWLHTGELGAGPVLAGVALGALASAILVVNNLRDRAGDLRAQKRTLAVRFGERFTRLEYTLLIAGAYACTTVAAALQGSWGWLAPVLSLPLAVRLVRRVWRDQGAALNPVLGATGKLELLFALLLSVGVSL